MPEPGHGEVLIKIHAVSVNYRGEPRTRSLSERIPNARPLVVEGDVPSQVECEQLAFELIRRGLRSMSLVHSVLGWSWRGRGCR